MCNVRNYQNGKKKSQLLSLTFSDNISVSSKALNAFQKCSRIHRLRRDSQGSSDPWTSTRHLPWPAVQAGKILTGQVVCGMDWKMAHRLKSEGADWCFWLNLAACHIQGPTGINTCPHPIQHLQKLSGW